MKIATVFWLGDRLVVTIRRIEMFREWNPDAQNALRRLGACGLGPETPSPLATLLQQRAGAAPGRQMKRCKPSRRRMQRVCGGVAVAVQALMELGLKAGICAHPSLMRDQLFTVAGGILLGASARPRVGPKHPNCKRRAFVCLQVGGVAAEAQAPGVRLPGWRCEMSVVGDGRAGGVAIFSSQFQEAFSVVNCHLSLIA